MSQPVANNKKNQSGECFDFLVISGGATGGRAATLDSTIITSEDCPELW